MTDEELLAFCDMLEAHPPTECTAPGKTAALHLIAAARESVALRRQVATLREALEPFADYSDTAADALDATKGTDR